MSQTRNIIAEGNKRLHNQKWISQNLQKSLERIELKIKEEEYKPVKVKCDISNLENRLKYLAKNENIEKTRFIENHPKQLQAQEEIQPKAPNLQVFNTANVIFQKQQQWDYRKTILLPELENLFCKWIEQEKLSIENEIKRKQDELKNLSLQISNDLRQQFLLQKNRLEESLNLEKQLLKQRNDAWGIQSD